MQTYTLQYAENDIECDGEDYVNLDEARDTAFDISTITMRAINIYEHFGVCSSLVEVIQA